MKLLDLQQQWSNQILRGQGEVCDQIDQGAEFNGAQRLKIYQSGYRGTLENALKSIYPVCLRLVGDRFFESMVSLFIQDYPCRSFDLADYGSEHARFIAQFPPADPLVYLADMAQLEWYYHQALHGSEAQTIDLQSLIHLDPKDWGSLKFSVHSHHFLLSSPYPIHRIWQINQLDNQNDEFVDLAEGSVNVFIGRKQLDMVIDVVNDAEWFMLQRFSQGILFEQVCSECIEQGILEIQPLLIHILQQGWIESWSLESS